jgi:GNAT superfamily N-acetyltransferase
MRLRPGTIDDVDVFARLMNGYHRTLRGEVLWERDELAAELLSPVNDPVTSDRYIEVDGEPVAALHTNFPHPYALARLYLAPPFFPDRVHNSRVLIESGLRLLKSRAGIREDAKVQIAIPAEDPDLIRLVRELGFRPERRVYMLEATTENASEPVWPEGVVVAPIDLSSDQDVTDGFAVFNAAFPPGSGGWRMEFEEYVHMLRRDPTAVPGLSLIARKAREPIGVATNFRDTTREQTGNVVHLGVVPKAQHQGLGRALLEESFRRFYAIGWSHARLATFTDIDGNGLQLFEGVGMYRLFHSEVLTRSIA